MSETQNSNVANIARKAASVFLAAALCMGLCPTVASASTESFADPSAENSFRYSNGQSIFSSDENAGDMSLFGVTNKNGYKSFTSFDTFKKGYCTGKNAYKGVDVSEHNGTIDWAKAKKAGIDFAIIRCGYGQDQRNQDDKQWKNNVNGCIKNKIPFGVYIYSYATTTARAKGEANHVLTCLNSMGLSPDSLSFPVYFDMEDSSTEKCNLASLAKTFCTAITSAGYSVGVYSSTSWWENKLTNKIFNSYPKWVAQYNTTIGLTYKGVSNFSSGNGIWQFTSTGKISGIPGDTDLNYTYMQPKTATLFQESYTQPATPYVKTVDDGDYVLYTHAKTTMAATVKDGSSQANANIHIDTSDMSAKQKFRFVRDPATGYYTISNSANGKAFGLTGSGGYYLTNVAQRDVDSSDKSQKWQVLKDSSGKLSIRNASNPAYALSLTDKKASGGSNVQVSAWGSKSHQQWGVVSPVVPNVAPSTARISNGTYSIALGKKTSRMLELSNGSSSNGANIQLNSDNKGANQKFKIQYDGDGYYHILSLVSGKALQVRSGSVVPGANVRTVYYSKNSNSQKWSVSKSGSRYVFTCKANGNVLEVAGGSTAVKANIQTSRYGSNSSQTFVLKKVKSKKAVSARTHRIKSVRNKRYGATIKSNSRSNNKAAVLGSSTATSSKFRFTFDKNTGFYRIKNTRSGKYLTISSSSLASGKSVRQVRSSKSYAQRWIIVRVAKGKYYIKSALDPQYYLDGGSRVKSGNTLKIYKKSSSRLQKWCF